MSNIGGNYNFGVWNLPTGIDSIQYSQNINVDLINKLNNLQVGKEEGFKQDHSITPPSFESPDTALIVNLNNNNSKIFTAMLQQGWGGNTPTTTTPPPTPTPTATPAPTTSKFNPNGLVVSLTCPTGKWKIKIIAYLNFILTTFDFEEGMAEILEDYIRNTYNPYGLSESPISIEQQHINAANSSWGNNWTTELENYEAVQGTGFWQFSNGIRVEDLPAITIRKKAKRKLYYPTLSYTPYNERYYWGFWGSPYDHSIELISVTAPPPCPTPLPTPTPTPLPTPAPKFKYFGAAAPPPPPPKNIKNMNCCDCNTIASIIEAQMLARDKLFENLKDHIDRRIKEEIAIHGKQLEALEVDLQPVINRINEAENNLWNGAKR